MGSVLSTSSSNAATHLKIVDVLKKTPFMQMMDEKTIHEIAACFQLVKYAKGTVIKNDPWLFFIVADGSVDISSLIPTKNRKQHLHEVLCQRKTGDYISFAAREQILGRLMEESFAKGNNNNSSPGSGSGAGTTGSAVSGNNQTVRKNLMAMLDLNRITADTFTGCTLLKLHRDKFLKLRGRISSRRSEGPGGEGGAGKALEKNHTRRFSDNEDDETDATSGDRLGANKNTKSKSKQMLRRTTMTRPEKFHLINSIVESEIVNFLFDIPFLENVDQSRLVTLSNLCSYMFIRKGDFLCREGEIGDKFFICIRGTLQASVQSKFVHTSHNKRPSVSGGGAPGAPGAAHGQGHSQGSGDRTIKVQALKKMSSGSYFGEISLLFKIPRIASITALEDSLLVFVDRVAFCNFLKIVPDATFVLLEHVRLNFLDTLIKQGCGFLTAIPSMKLHELSYMSEILEFAKGSYIMSKGDAKQKACFHLVLRGEVEVEYFPLTTSTKSSTTTTMMGGDDGVIPLNEFSTTTAHTPVEPVREILRVKPGGYFGHEAIMLGIPSPISVKCLDQCLTLRLTPELFDEFFLSMPALYAEFCIKCLRDQVRPEHVMQHYDAHKLWAADCVNRRRQHEITLFESIEDFTWEADLAEDRIHELALMVYLKFLHDDAPLRVEMPPEILIKIEEMLSSQDVDRNIFFETRNKILNDMEDAHFEEFKQNGLFQDLLKTLECPQMIYDGLTAKQRKKLDMNAKRYDVYGDGDGNDGNGTSLELEDVTEYETNYIKNKSRTASGVVAKSYGRRSSQKAYVVGVGVAAGGGPDASSAGERGSAPVANTYMRRKTRTDIGGATLQRNVSTSFVC